LAKQEGKVNEGKKSKLSIAKYYKDLFRSSQRNDFSLDESQTNNGHQINEEENKILTEEFTEIEVRDAIFQMKHNKAPMASWQSSFKCFGLSSKMI